MKPKRQEDSSCVFAYYFVAALAIAAIPQEKKKAPKLLRRRSGRSFVKAVGTIRQENRQGRGKLPPCMPQSECGTGHTGYHASPDPSPGGSQDTGGAFRSRVQRPGVHRRHHRWQGARPTRYRTDRGKSKKETGSWPHRKTVDAARLFHRSRASAPRKGSENGHLCQRVKCAHLNTITTSKEIYIYVYYSKQRDILHPCRAA